MRIDANERVSILECVARHFGEGCTVTLFGSRADDGRRGGDVDLHVVTGNTAPVSLSSEIRCRLDLEGALGDQRVDLLVRSPDKDLLPFDSLVTGRGVRL